jgi:hypothetical protein
MRPNDPSVYGVFPDQYILGQSVILTYESLPDGDGRCLDLFGSCLSRGQAVMHISGKNAYGEPCRRQRIREMAWETVCATDGTPVQFSPNQPHAVLITTEQESEPLHIVFYSPAASYVSLYSLLYEFNEAPFTPLDIVSRITRKYERDYLMEKQHQDAMRRLLEDSLQDRVADYALDRVGRWRYRFRRLTPSERTEGR